MHRVEDFKRFWVQQLVTLDCDTPIYALKYIIDRMELNVEQRFWICWIYANTYQIGTTWVIFNEFPDFENVDTERMQNWLNKNIKRLPYQKDQKYQKSSLVNSFISYRDNIYLKHLTQQSFFQEYRSNYTSLNEKVLSDFFKFGRYTTWFYLQALDEICQMNLVATDLQLGHKSCWAPRAGLCYALGKDEWAKDKKRKFTRYEIKTLEKSAQSIKQDVQKKFSKDLRIIKPNLFSMETALCAYYKLFRRKNGRYLGYYLDRMASDINNTSKHDWKGINWDLLWESRKECLFEELIDNSGNMDKDKMNLYLDTGEFYGKSSLKNSLDNFYHSKNLEI